MAGFSLWLNTNFFGNLALAYFLGPPWIYRMYHQHTAIAQYKNVSQHIQYISAYLCGIIQISQKCKKHQFYDFQSYSETKISNYRKSNEHWNACSWLSQTAGQQLALNTNYLTCPSLSIQFHISLVFLQTLDNAQASEEILLTKENKKQF